MLWFLGRRCLFLSSNGHLGRRRLHLLLLGSRLLLLGSFDLGLHNSGLLRGVLNL